MAKHQPQQLYPHPNQLRLTKEKARRPQKDVVRNAGTLGLVHANTAQKTVTIKNVKPQ